MPVIKIVPMPGPGGEGIVFPTSYGLIKLINPNFGIAHFSKER